MAIFSTVREVWHQPPSRNGFFSGSGGRQVLREFWCLFGWRIHWVDIDYEDVPHWHYVQQATLGISEWRSRLLQEQKDAN